MRDILAILLLSDRLETYLPSPALHFPSDFLFGVATAAYQIEGAASKDGRGPSIWDTFSHQPGKVLGGDTGDVACDHYHLWEQDLDLIASLGVDAYRLSIAWPRIYPQGDGPLNQPGIDFYSRLLDGCKARNIKTYVTLYHWDLPQALADKGGWTNRSTAEHFARYAETIVKLLGDRIDSISTFNEPWCSSILSHLHGVHAPGTKDLDTTLAVIHGQHRAHGLAVQAMRAVRPDLPVGIVLNTQAIRPASDSAADKAAAARHHNFNNGLFLDPLFNGRYPDEVIEALGRRFPQNWEDDLVSIHQPLDYWGLNYYTPEYISDSINPQAHYPTTRGVSQENVKRTDIGWEIDASAMLEMMLHLYATYDLPPCYITENGAAYNQGVVDGAVDDQPRVDYLEQHLQAASDAVQQGVPLHGYFAWSLMDNFEWAEGYSMRFGLVHVNYETMQRTLKKSALWYRDLVNHQRSTR